VEGEITAHPHIGEEEWMKNEQGDQTISSDHDETAISGNPTGEELDIPIETATLEQMVVFFSDRLQAALTEQGAVYISVPNMCKALGLNAPSQIRRMKDTSSLLKVMRRIPLRTPGGVQPVSCLRVDKVSLWLASVETKKMKQTNEKQRYLREKIERYQEDLAPVATQVFLRVLREDSQTAPQIVPIHQEPSLLHTVAREVNSISTVVPSLQQGVATLLQAANSQTIYLETLMEMSASQDARLQQVDAKLQHVVDAISSQALDLSQAVELLSDYLANQEHLEAKLERVDERTKGLTHAHALDIQNAVGHIVRAIRRKNASITEDVACRMVYGRLKSRFRPVTTYKEIDDDRFEEVMEYLRTEYQSVLKDQPTQNSLF
jgi:hypothetical protein